MEQRWILHLDVNNFYASTHMAMNPGLRSKAVVVLSNNDGNIIARSPLAKAMGIPMGQPFHEIKRLVEQGKVTAFSSLYPLYGDLSTRVMNILRRFIPTLELYSIDEVFGEVQGTLQEVTALARQVKETIGLWVRLPVSVGLAATKSLAKVATYVAKRQPEHDGIFAFSDPQAVNTVLKTLPVSELWGIGRQSAKKLAAIGVNTAFEFTQLPDGWIQKHLTIQGLRLADELRGEVRKPLQGEMKPKKSIMVAPSFGRPVRDWETVCKALKRQVIKAGEKLRRQHSLAGKLTVFINTNRYQPKKPQYSASQTFRLPFASNENGVLFDCAKAVLKTLFREWEGYEYHKVGVMLSALSPDTGQQLKLFVETPDPRRGRVEKTLDRIRLKYGKDLVWFADQMPGKESPPDWLSRQQYKSQAPTTNWKEILKVA